jgi:hypothetical protein
MVVENLHLPICVLGEPLVHFKKIIGKKPGLLSPGTGSDFDDNILTIQRILGDQKLFEFCLQVLLFFVQTVDLIPCQLVDFQVIILEKLQTLIDSDSNRLIVFKYNNNFAEV